MTVFHFLLEYYTIFFVWGSAIAATFFFRRSWPLEFKVLAIFLVIYAITDLAGNIMGFNDLNNHFLYNLLYDARFLVISFFYYQQLRNYLIKKVILLFFIVFPLFVIANNIWFQGFYEFQTYSSVFGSSFILLCSVIYVWQLYVSEETHSIFRDCVFWFSLAWFFYDGINIPYLGMLNYLLENFYDLAAKYYVLVIDISDCIRNLLLITGFLCLRASKK